MCGIVGFAGFGDDHLLSTMMSKLAHRGPDGSGTFHAEDLKVWLGHLRLSIIDLAGGAQPMQNADETISVTYNGEIYNHAELRRELEALGHFFVTNHSDTEVLIHGYLEWGEALPQKLNGMFAFAILDRNKALLFLARDRFGEKPLYYAATADSFVFASEMTALLPHPAISGSVSAKSMRKLFAYGYVPAPLSILDGVWKLPAGHCMTVELGALRPTVKPYWRFEFVPDEDVAARGEEMLAEELRTLLIQATDRRLMSDVPLGIFLSGGIDSSGILAVAAARRGHSTLQSFTIGFEERSYDESHFARQVARHIGTRHSVDVLKLEQARDVAQQVLGRMDEPICDPSIVPTYLLSALASKQVKVALSGDGGDELFAGYDPFDALAPAGLYSKVVPHPLHRLLLRAVNVLPRSNRNMSLDYKLRRTLAGLSQREAAWAPAWMGPIQAEEFYELFQEFEPDEQIYSEAIDLWETGSAKTRVDRLLQFFVHFYLQDNILAKVDRTTMMCSLETRAVFLDNDLVDFCQKLPHRMKYFRGNRKYLLKKALAPLLPAQILARRKKGFGIPVAEWLRDIPKEVPYYPIADVDLDWVRRQWECHRNGITDQRLFLWTWWSLQKASGLSKAFSNS